MSLIAPPQPPEQIALHDDNSRRVHFRLWQISLALLTVLATAWFCTLVKWKSPLTALPGILAIVIAKHILVAILVQGVDFHFGPGRKPRTQPPTDLSQP